MSISKYFWDINEKALKETTMILKNPKHPRFPVKMVIFLCYIQFLIVLICP